MRAALRYAFCICGRVSEVVGQKSPTDRSPANGPKPEDAEAVLVMVGNKKEKAWVPSVKTSKHGAMIRKPGLAADYDPWVPELKSYFEGKPLGKPVFDFTRFNLGDYVDDNDVFEGLVWRLEEYHIFLNKNGVMEVKRVPTHLVRFTIHRLRDARATNLIDYYGFDGYGLSVHGGWKPSGTVPGMSPVMAKYTTPIYTDWEKPFPKLLKPLAVPPF